MSANATTSSSSSDLVLPNPKAFDTAHETRADVRAANSVLAGISSKGPKWYEVGAPAYRDMIERGEAVLPKPTYLEGARDAVLPTMKDLGHDIDVPLRIYAPPPPLSGGRDGDKEVKGLLIHFHGGGWTIGSHRHSDKRLKLYAERCNLLAISVGYRHGPEHVYPAASNDCLAGARWLLDNLLLLGTAADGTTTTTTSDQNPFSGVSFPSSSPNKPPPVFMTGESAGATLSMQTILSLFREDALRPTFRHRPAAIKGLILSYGCYDLSMGLPSHYTTFPPPPPPSSNDDKDDDDDDYYTSPPLVLSRDILRSFQESWVPASCFFAAEEEEEEGVGKGKNNKGINNKNDIVEARRNPVLSPLYEDLPRLVHRAAAAAAGSSGGMRLPPALFLCGSLDPLLDDTVLMGLKWRVATATSKAAVTSAAAAAAADDDDDEKESDSDSIIRIWPGAAHAFDIMDGVSAAEEAREAAVEFVGARI